MQVSLYYEDQWLVVRFSEKKCYIIVRDSFEQKNVVK